MNTLTLSCALSYRQRILAANPHLVVGYGVNAEGYAALSIHADFPQPWTYLRTELQCQEFLAASA